MKTKIIFSEYYVNLKELIIDDKIIIDAKKQSLKWNVDMIKRLEILTKKNDGTLYITDYADFTFNKRGIKWSDVNFSLPFLWTDIFTKHYWKSKSNLDNYRWVITINTSEELELPHYEMGKIKRNRYAEEDEDPFEIHVTKKWLKKEDIVKYTKLWLDKYFPDNTIKVKFVKGI